MSTNESNIESNNNTNTKPDTTINKCQLCLDVMTFNTNRYPKMICKNYFFFHKFVLIKK